MLNEEICKLRDKLNKSIEDGEDYSVVYKLSVELDELIAEFYKDNNASNNSKKWNLLIETIIFIINNNLLEKKPI